MVESSSCPGKSIDRMALAAVCRESAECMMRLGGGCKIGLVAIYAFYTQGFKLQQGCRRMTLVAIGCIVGAQKREPAELMHFGNVRYDPRFRRMAAGAVKPDGLVVHVGMTGHAFGLSLRENQCGVAKLATHILVQAFKGKCGRVMVKGIGSGDQFPAFSRMAVVAGDVEIIAVG